MKAIAIAIALVAAAGHAASAGHGCKNNSHVVGYQHCTWFGTWSRDVDKFPLRFEIGWLHHEFPTRPLQLSTPSARPSIADTSTANAMPDTITDGSAFRLLGGGRVLYAGVELGMTSLTGQPQFAGLPTGSGVTSAALAIAGAQASLWRLGFGAELAAGGRYTIYDYCVDPRSCTTSAGQGAKEIEARVRAEVFFAPRWSVGVAYGHSLIDPGDSSLYVFAGVHVRALDGRY